MKDEVTQVKMVCSETCGFYCMQQLVGVNGNEEATLPAQRGWKILAVNQEPMSPFYWDSGSGSIWYGHHLASITPVSPESET